MEAIRYLPLTGVEDLTICVSAMSALSRRWISDKEDKEVGLTIYGRQGRRTKFNIGDAAVRGLKKCTINTDYHENLVGDLEVCVCRRNKGLNEAHEWQLRDEVISRFHS